MRDRIIYKGKTAKEWAARIRAKGRSAIAQEEAKEKADA